MSRKRKKFEWGWRRQQVLWRNFNIIKMHQYKYEKAFFFFSIFSIFFYIFLFIIIININNLYIYIYISNFYFLYLICIPDQHTRSIKETFMSHGCTHSLYISVVLKGVFMAGGMSQFSSQCLSQGPHCPVIPYMGEWMKRNPFPLGTHAEWEPVSVQLCLHMSFSSKWTT